VKVGREEATLEREGVGVARVERKGEVEILVEGVGVL